MENLAHSLTGLAMAKAGLGTRVPFGTTLLVLAANAPDLDVIVSPLGSLYYLHYHRGITHSLLGTAVTGLLLGWLFWLFRKRSQVPDASLLTCLVVALAGALTHPLLDWTNSYGIRLLQPFSDHRSFGDLVFIVDPWLWLILGVGTFMSAAWRWWAGLLWILGLAVALALTGAFLPAIPGLRWFLPALTLAVPATLWVRRRYGIAGPVAARAALVGMVAYWGLLGFSRGLAWDHAAEALAGESPEIRQSMALLPLPVDPARWQVFAQDAREVLGAVASAHRPGLEAPQREPRNLDSPAVQAALETCPGQILAFFGRYTVYSVEETPAGPSVTFRDVRFGPSASGFGTYRIDLAPDLKAVRSGEPCPPLDSLIPCEWPTLTPGR